MIKRLLLVLILAACAALIWHYSQRNPRTVATVEKPLLPVAPPEIANGYKLVWQDEFDGTQLDPTKWKHREPGKKRNDGFNDPSCVSLDGQGQLHLAIKQVGEEFHGGMIGTSGLFSTKFGYFECRARMQTAIGCWSAFWLQAPGIGNATGEPDEARQKGVECDIFEYLASRPDGFQHAMHWSGYGPFHKSKGFRVKAPEVASGWHTVGVEWRPDGYSFYLDGKKTWDFNDPVSQTEQYIILSTQIGAWGGDIKQAKLPDDVAFDYVRVWQKPDQGTTANNPQAKTVNN